MSESRQGKLYDHQTNSNVNLYFASYDDIDELCIRVVLATEDLNNMAFGHGKNSWHEPFK